MSEVDHEGFNLISKIFLKIVSKLFLAFFSEISHSDICVYTLAIQ